MKTTVLRRSELYRQVWERTLTSLGAEMGISDNGLKKICARYDIPRPPPGAVSPLPCYLIHTPIFIRCERLFSIVLITLPPLLYLPERCANSQGLAYSCNRDFVVAGIKI